MGEPGTQQREHADRTTIVIATRDRVARLLDTLHHHAESAPATPVIVVDNASSDGTADAVHREFPHVRVLRSARNLGAVARNIGASRAHTPYVAFSDDDSWWDADALPRAEAALDAYPGLGLIAARTLVGGDDLPDELVPVMAGSPLRSTRPLPGPPLLGFMACSAVLRREAFLSVGGFSPLLFFVAEEKLLSYDLAAAGWSLAYMDSVVAHHHPAGNRPDQRRRNAAERRNTALIAWMRRPTRVALSETTTLLRDCALGRTSRRALWDTARRLPLALSRRRPLPAEIEQQITTLEAT